MTIEFTAAELVKIADDAATKYKGQADVLESAIGMLFIGRLYGWKVMYLIHSKATIRKYEAILGIAVREAFPEVGVLAKRSIAFRLAQNFTSFWKVVNGGEPTFKNSSELR